MKKNTGYLLGVSIHSDEHVSRRYISELNIGNNKEDQLYEGGFKFYSKFKLDKYQIIFDVATYSIKKSEIQAEDIDLIIIASAFGEGHRINAGNEKNLEDYFKYTGMRLQHEIGAVKARVIGLSQLGCISMHTAVDIALNLLSNNITNILCLSFDQVPDNISRYVLHSVVSDACGACIVTNKPKKAAFKILSYAQKSNGYYWDSSNTQDRLEAAYYPTSVRIIRRAVKDSGYSLSDFNHIMPNNVSTKSWEILSKSCGIDYGRIHLSTLEEYGHTASIDSFININKAIENNLIVLFDKAILFGFGFGAHWCAMTLEYIDE